MNIKLIGKIFLVYFGLLGSFFVITWGKYLYDINSLGGEMGDTVFLILLFITTVYYLLFALWTYRLSKKQDAVAIRIQLALIFLFGIVASIFGFIYIYK